MKTQEEIEEFGRECMQLKINDPAQFKVLVKKFINAARTRSTGSEYITGLANKLEAGQQ